MNVKHQLAFTARRLRKRRRVPKMLAPRAIERAYWRDILTLVAAMRDALGPLRQALPGLLAREDSYRADAKVSEIMAGAHKAIAHAVDPAKWERRAREAGAAAAEFGKKQTQAQVKASLGIDVLVADQKLAKRLEAFAAENVTLIVNIPAKTMAEIEILVTRGVANGARHENLAREIEQKLGFAEDRAKLIARDQVGKLYGQVAADRQKELGATHFFWRTVSDERVREEHAALDGQRFAYDDPPADEGLPGEAINCRCFAEADFDGLLASFDD